MAYERWHQKFIVNYEWRQSCHAKYKKNIFFVLLFLAYAVTAVPMEHANLAQELVDHEDEVALVQAQNADETAENEWASLSWWTTKAFNGWLVFDGGRRLLKNYWAPRRIA